MTRAVTIADTPVQVTDIALHDRPQVEAVHAFLMEQLGSGLVEGLSSFIESLSPDTDPAVAPAAATAKQGGAMLGAIVGAYLQEVNVGMILYSAVRGSSRGHGVYTSLRRRLVDALVSLAGTLEEPGSSWSEGPRELYYMVSEVEPGSRLHRIYADRWGAFEVQCGYMQPPVQGLDARELALMFQPMEYERPPDRNAVVSVVREIYGRVYRMSSAASAPYLERVVESMQSPPLSPPPAGEEGIPSAICGKVMTGAPVERA